MNKKILLLVAIFALCSCRSRPFKVQSLSPKPTTVPKTEPDLDLALKESMSLRYKQAKSPSFAIIRGFYSLPVAKPYGAVSVISSYSYQTKVNLLNIGEPKKAYAIEEMSGADASSLSQAINSLLDVGVKIKEISLVDAIKIAKSEENAELKKESLLLSKTLLPDVDYLISMYRSQDAQGPVLVGRVIKNDGQLLAFRVMPNAYDQYSLSSMITSLFEDTIKRLQK